MVRLPLPEVAMVHGVCCHVAGVVHKAVAADAGQERPLTSHAVLGKHYYAARANPGPSASAGEADTDFRVPDTPAGAGAGRRERGQKRKQQYVQQREEAQSASRASGRAAEPAAAAAAAHGVAAVGLKLIKAMDTLSQMEEAATKHNEK